MALIPKKVKHRKWHTTRRNHTTRPKVETRGVNVDFGSFGLKATTQGRIRSNQLESARKAISRNLGKTGRMWIRVFCDRPYTQKPAEVKLGKGKGDVQGYEVEVWPGRVLFEVDGIPETLAREALRKAGTKLPVKGKVVARE
jgi:large subunit ribosomal protein L16